MKKYLIIFVFILSGVLVAYAGPVTIIDPGGQEEAKVVNDALKVSEKTKAVNGIFGSGMIHVGKCYVKTINMHSTAAGDNIVVWNDVEQPTKTTKNIKERMEFEMGLSANNSSTSIDANGTEFKRGIYIEASKSYVQTSIVYDY